MHCAQKWHGFNFAEDSDYVVFSYVLLYTNYIYQPRVVLAGMENSHSFFGKYGFEPRGGLFIWFGRLEYH